MGERIITEAQARRVGESLGVTWDLFGVPQFAKGMRIELEHGSRFPDLDVTGDDLLVTGKIALAHLREFPDYYTRLEKLEREADAHWRKKRKS